jgi:hypothetical protein
MAINEERDSLDDLGIDGSLMLKLILKEYCVKVLAEFIWLKLGISKNFLSNWATFRFSRTLLLDVSYNSLTTKNVQYRRPNNFTDMLTCVTHCLK